LEAALGSGATNNAVAYIRKHHSIGKKVGAQASAFLFLFWGNSIKRGIVQTATPRVAGRTMPGFSWLQSSFFNSPRSHRDRMEVFEDLRGCCRVTLGDFSDWNVIKRVL
jgi:hypothetical protein